ncbi:MAG: hypothetical protein ACOCT9_00990 [archaeon]
MSALANLLLGIAQSIANIRNSKMRIRLRENEVEFWFESKSSNEIITENHYKDADIYIGNSANPVKFDFGNYNDSSIIEAIDNLIATEYYKTIIQQTAIQRMFNIEGTKQEQIIRILYAIGAGLAIVLIMLLAQYGGM